MTTSEMVKMTTSQVDKMTTSEMVKMTTSQVDKMTTPIQNNKKY